jgi:hypothetical protein
MFFGRNISAKGRCTLKNLSRKGTNKTENGKLKMEN